MELHASSDSSHVFVLGGLKKFTAYQVILQAVNSMGEGPVSTSMVATTLEDGELRNLLLSKKERKKERNVVVVARRAQPMGEICASSLH